MQDRQKPTQSKEASTTEALAAGLQRLAPDTRDKIFTYTFTTAPGPRTIDKSYKPPALLQVDRRSRALYVASLYGDADTIFHVADEETCIKWLTSLMPEHRKLLRSVCLLADSQQLVGMERYPLKATDLRAAHAQFVATRRLRGLKADLVAKGVEMAHCGLRGQVLWAEVSIPEREVGKVAIVL